jgi:hypothetical protein
MIYVYLTANGSYKLLGRQAPETNMKLAGLHITICIIYAILNTLKFLLAELCSTHAEGEHAIKNSSLKTRKK